MISTTVTEDDRVVGFCGVAAAEGDTVSVHHICANASVKVINVNPNPKSRTLQIALR